MAPGIRSTALVVALTAFASAGCTVTIVTRGALPPPVSPRIEANANDPGRGYDVGRRTPARPEPARWNDTDSRPGRPATGHAIRPERTPGTPDAARAGAAASPAGTRGRARKDAGADPGSADAANEPARPRQ